MESNHAGSSPLPSGREHAGRAFNVAEPNRTWAEDISYVWTAQGWLYQAVALDLDSLAVIGWAFNDATELWRRKRRRDSCFTGTAAFNTQPEIISGCWRRMASTARCAARDTAGTMQWSTL